MNRIVLFKFCRILEKSLFNAFIYWRFYAIKNSYLGVNPIIVKYVKHYANYLKSINYFTHESLEDIEQELLCEIWPRLDQYNKKKSSYSTFVAKVTQSCARNLSRNHSYSRHRVTFCIDDDLPDCKYLESEMISRVDVNEIISRLTKSYRNIFELLKIFNISEVSKITGVPKTTIYNIIKHVRNRFLSCK
ncbi:MAG: hypothetical protein PG981_001400 [Wolbachia endosymbiont of Ctenocephalides orientis wCori]|nr:MAG: hypothetical protein PG981_001400 [Wolbachia endosymbiont of Ctenocephalides orientis wCori]